MKKYLIALAFVVVSGFYPSAEAEVAVRHATTSEVEFQALAQALGFTTVAELLTDGSFIPPETAALFQLRLAEAEAEWLKLKTGRHSKSPPSPSLDRFLELSLEADWSAAERKTFLTYFVRKLSMNPELEEELFARMSTFLDDGQSIDFTDAPAAETRWRNFLAAKSESQLEMRSLPTDIVAIVLNGKVISRHNDNFRIPKTSMRATFISNTYLPVSVRLDGSETEWPNVTRTSWVLSDCSLRPVPPVYGPLELKSLGAPSCLKASSPNLKTNAADKIADVKSKFGFSNDMSAQPMPPPTKTLLEKSWFWGALGVIAIGAVVAMRSQEQGGAVQPANHENW